MKNTDNILLFFFLFSKSDKSQNVLGKYRSLLLYFLEKDFHWKKTGHSENCPSLLFLDMGIFWTSSGKMNSELQLEKAEEIVTNSNIFIHWRDNSLTVVES